MDNKPTKFLLNVPAGSRTEERSGTCSVTNDKKGPVKSWNSNDGNLLKHTFII